MVRTWESRARELSRRKEKSGSEVQVRRLATHASGKMPAPGNRHLAIDMRGKAMEVSPGTNPWHSRPLARATALALAASPVRARRRRNTCEQSNALVLGRHCVQGQCDVQWSLSTTRKESRFWRGADGQGGSAEMTCVSPELLGPDSKVLEQGLVKEFRSCVWCGVCEGKGEAQKLFL